VDLVTEKGGRTLYREEGLFAAKIWLFAFWLFPAWVGPSRVLTVVKAAFMFDLLVKLRAGRGLTFWSKLQFMFDLLVKTPIYV